MSVVAPSRSRAKERTKPFSARLALGPLNLCASAAGAASYAGGQKRHQHGNREFAPHRSPFLSGVIRPYSQSGQIATCSGYFVRCSSAHLLALGCRPVPPLLILHVAMARRQLGVLLGAVGIVAVLVAVLADPLGIGGAEDAFGWKQVVLLDSGSSWLLPERC